MVVNAVRGLVSQRTETELFLLVLLFSIVVFIMIKIDAFVAAPTFAGIMGIHPDATATRFSRFVSSTALNIALQFQSSFVAMLALAALSPETDPFNVIMLAAYGIILLWMLNESIAR